MDCSLPGASLSMGFLRQEYWSGLPFPTPGDLLDPGIKRTSLVSSALAGGFFITVSFKHRIYISVRPQLSINYIYIYMLLDFINITILLRSIYNINIKLSVNILQ